LGSLRELLWHRLTRRELGVLFALAAADAVVLLAIAYAVAVAATDVALPLIPTYGTVFLVLVATLVCLADRRRVSWWLVCAAVLGGPVSAVAVLGCARRPHSPPNA
jgi:hypothetical protein